MTARICFGFWLAFLGLFVAPVDAQSVPEPRDFAEPPHWPVGFKLPREIVESWKDKNAARIVASPQADVLVWTPPGVKRIRAVLMFANNTDLVRIGEHKAIRDVAAKQEMAIVYWQQVGGGAVEFADPPTAAESTFKTLLDLAAEKTGIAEFRNAPWILMGKSSRGRFAFRPTWWFPGRTIASISYHGEVPTWPMSDWSRADKSESVMHLNIQGLSEWDGTWYRHVRPGLLNYNRNTAWLAHQAVIYGVDHGYYPDYYLYPNFGQPMDKSHRMIRCTDVWNYIAKFIDTSIELRVPKGAYATDKPVKLVNIKRESGYLIHPRAPEELLGSKWFALRKGAGGLYQTIAWPDEPTPVYDPQQGMLPPADLIKPAGEVPADQQGDYLWIADADLARAWLELHGLYKVGDKMLKQN